MGSRVRRGAATGPAQWLLVFLQARDLPPRAHLGMAVGPAEWLLVFLDGAGTDPARWAGGAGEVTGPAETVAPTPLPVPANMPDTEHVFVRRVAAQGI